ncbi:putative Mannosyl-oligosaccharide 1,2-alpha-mannosidase MNS2 [Blattamonas nauphoetae]|uniref:alpha-1,2-Mannosidase n=1 Tax=Blattamonas nauphoetae TaxID=2049346 RepID=A0ABQ9XYT3_9EUKA|nr:putative Mannosyl-oligosaccharide 1,2-alpha-mannosidase MNS2 [Blattamonas nauphoetae]
MINIALIFFFFGLTSYASTSKPVSNQAMFPLTRKTPVSLPDTRDHKPKPEPIPTDPPTPPPQPPKPVDPVKPTEPTIPSDLIRFVDVNETSPANRWPKLPNETKCAERREAIKNAFLYGWVPYEKHAFGHDEIHPISKKPNNWLGGQATSIVDSLATMKLMGLEDEYQRCRDWIKNKMNVYKGGYANLFETGIRILAGFITAFDLTGEEFYLTKAEEIGDAIIVEFENNSKFFIPGNRVSLSKPSRKPTFEQRKKDILKDKTRTPGEFYTPNSTDLFHNRTTANDGSTAWLAEFGLFLEFVALSDRTGDDHYARYALRAAQTTLAASRRSPDVVLSGIDKQTGRGTGVHVVGAPADSFFEYLIKTELYTSPDTITMRDDQSEEKTLGDHWDKLMAGFETTVKTMPSGDKYFPGNAWETGFPHLTCFVAGNLALGSFLRSGWTLPKKGTPSAKHFSVAEDIVGTCHKMYNLSASGLSGEFVTVDGQFTAVGEYKLRPETIESMFYLFRFTGDEKYQDWAWEIFLALEKNCKLPPDDQGNPQGYASQANLNNAKSTPRDEQPSFLFAETLKYLYLIFSDPATVLPLDQWVFTTEGHPFARRKYLVPAKK